MHPEIKSPQKTEVVFPEEDSPETLQRIAQAPCFGDMMYFARKGQFETKAWHDACIKYPGLKEAEEVILRYHQPWPKWVLKVATEVLHVQMPTIPKQRIAGGLEAAHWFLFELRMDGSTPKETFPQPNLDAELLGAVTGHIAAFIEDLPRWVERNASQKPLPPELNASLEKFSVDNFQKEFTPKIANYLNARPTSLLTFNEAFEKARRETFDRYGSLKETPLTPIYRQILCEWVEIEKLSGPTELTRFLGFNLKGNKYQDDNKLARVKMICNRMRITFQRSVK